MNKIKMTTLALFGAAVLSLGSSAIAGGVGYIDYQKVQESYPLAQQAIKEVDSKATELQQYMLDKEKQYKALDTPLKKQNFEDATARELNTKQEALYRLKSDKEELVFNKIQAAAKQVLVEQKLDAVLDFRVVFVGGVDITDLVIQKLKSGSF
ncbi:MAG: OmpH family outer membrane protein [Brachyspira sp.]|nr:OmpH family outer membrane protein [Brachyspira sp.]